MGPEIRLVCPAHAAGSPAELLVSLEQADGGALLGGGDRGRQTRDATSDDCDLVHVHASCHDNQDRNATAQLARC